MNKDSLLRVREMFSLCYLQITKKNNTDSWYLRAEKGVEEPFIS